RVGRGRGARSLPAARRLLRLPPLGLRAAAAAAAATAPAPAPDRPCAPGPRAPTPPPRLPGASGAPAARLTLKFLAVLLAAGMLAFLGAVICIIASVPLAASPARALPGGTDNASAAAGAAASPGPQRSLSALHGASASAGPSALPGAPAASAYPLPPGPLFSRFLCTPLAAACPSGTEQGDAAGAAPGEREELLLLQSTAEQLRQTALQQEARIRADQDTIRELTGKLGRCESGLPRGLQDAGPRRDTMADGAWDSPALILELEDAVRALRDRIDRIEVSAARRRGAAGVGGAAARVQGRPMPAPHPRISEPRVSCVTGRIFPCGRGGRVAVRSKQVSGTVTAAPGARQKGSNKFVVSRSVGQTIKQGRTNRRKTLAIPRHGGGPQEGGSLVEKGEKVTAPPLSILSATRPGEDGEGKEVNVGPPSSFSEIPGQAAQGMPTRGLAMPLTSSPLAG
ncbi:Hypothetical predicted protein, partial [Marmota monax]